MRWIALLLLLLCPALPGLADGLRGGMRPHTAPGAAIPETTIVHDTTNVPPLGPTVQLFAITTNFGAVSIEGASADVYIYEDEYEVAIDAELTAGDTTLSALLVVLETSDLGICPPAVFFWEGESPASRILLPIWQPASLLWGSSPHMLRVFLFDANGLFHSDSCSITFLAP